MSEAEDKKAGTGGSKQFYKTKVELGKTSMNV
jgi:hypothetical protein